MLGEQLAVACRGVLCPAVGVTDAPGCRSARGDSGPESGDGQARIDSATDGIAHDAARPCVEDERNVDEPGRHRDVGQIAGPELIGTLGHDVACEIGEYRQVVFAVGGGYETPPPPGLQFEYSHEPTHFLAVDDNPLLA